MPTWSLTARWIFPVDAAPLEQGVITIRDGVIESVMPRGTRSADRDLGNVAILPGLVNAHTHLDLTGLRGQCPPTLDFTDWLRGVIRHRRSQTPAQVEEDIRAGLAECLRFGTTLIGDIAAGGQSWSVLASAALRSVVFYELLGLTEERAEAAFESARVWLADHAHQNLCHPGLSPHAPYSVRASLYSKVARIGGARRTRVRPGELWGTRYRPTIALATHLAETLDEMSLIEKRQGPMVEFLQELGVWDPSGLVDSPRTISRQFRRENSPTLLVHANYLNPKSWIPRTSTIVYCPRTHAAFGHPPHPFREFLARGMRVAIGTDSLASNPDLDVLAEIRFLHHRYPDVSGATLLRMATVSGAESLGWADETGSLSAGKSADLIVLPLPAEDAADPHQLILESEQRVTGVLFRGAWVRDPDAAPQAAATEKRNP